MKNDTQSKNPKKSRIMGRGGKRPGAGRPSVGEGSRKVQIYVAGDVVDRLQAQAEKADLRFADYVRIILSAAANQ